MDIEHGKNTGVIIGPEHVRPTDFVAGAETGIAYDDRNPSGDWEPFKPTDERQLRQGFYDTLSCVTFSALNIVETQIRWLMETGKIPEAFLRQMKDLGYIDENGHPNFNDHFTAVMSGTTMNGNSLQKVWDSIRNDGLLPQAEGQQVGDFANTAAWLDRSTITQEQIDKAKKFKEMFDISYEWVVINEPGAWDKFAFHVKQAPLHIATPTCGSWNTSPPSIVTQCGDYKTLNHATSYFGQSPGAYHKDLDHYNPFVKWLDWNYYIPYAIKGIVYVKATQPTPVPPVDHFTYQFRKNLYYGNAGDEVHKLQQALQHLKRQDGSTYLKVGVFGPYGPQTAAAVAAFQKDHGIPDDPPGYHFGPLTRKAMNTALT